MNGEVNCILQVCCPEGSEASVQALAREMVKGLGVSLDTALHYAAWVQANFDLAEKGTLAPFKGSIARLAREPQAPHKS